MGEVLTIRQCAQRCKQEGLYCSEYAIRQFVRTGAIPARKAGKKYLVYFPNLSAYLKCETGADNLPTRAMLGGIRQVEL